MGEAAKLLFGGHDFRDVDWWEIEAFLMGDSESELWPVFCPV